MTISNQFCIEHGSAPCLETRRRMRRANDPSRLRRRGQWRRREAQQQAGDPRHPRRQCQLAAGDEIELPRLAPDFQHHGAERVAGQRIGRCPQRGLHVGRAHRHQQARIEAEFAPPAHRQRAGFDFRKILPYPQQRPPRGDAPRQPCDESGRRGTLPSFREHLMHRAQGKTAPQRRIGLGMAERRPVRRRGVVGFEALDTAAQPRKRACACAGHAPLLKKKVGRHGFEENQWLAHLFMICSNKAKMVRRVNWNTELKSFCGRLMHSRQERPFK
jgi:hypothetical protein